MNHEKRVVDALAPLCEPLYDALTEGRARARERHPEFVGEPGLGSVVTHVARGLALYALRSRELGPWTLVPQNNAGIALSLDSYSIRVLHQLPDKSAPPPGSNRVRRSFYGNGTLDPEMFPVSDKLLALWGDDEKGALMIRIVRPLGVWSFGARHKVDLDFVLPPMADDLEALVYDTADDDIIITIPGEEGETSVEHGVGS
ncbi:hypothetical protein OCAE111667_23650 [Occultella aeris]|uniref:Uncharacterized protein n=1 Tax=Occultella aeris TaxID=2761496 RepID=A0A7M4DHI9_9MICO|nr:hypothetical protein [Occultella aeris]VZO36382.1 hypothetical protein HALOF300_01587 [Occultella aeris]